MHETLEKIISYGAAIVRLDALCLCAEDTGKKNCAIHGDHIFTVVRTATGQISYKMRAVNTCRSGVSTPDVCMPTNCFANVIIPFPVGFYFINRFFFIGKGFIFRQIIT